MVAFRAATRSYGQRRIDGLSDIAAAEQLKPVAPTALAGGIWLDAASALITLLPQQLQHTYPPYVALPTGTCCGLCALVA